ncbi:MAG: CapA family protein [Patescibacteria group bacterium]
MAIPSTVKKSAFSSLKLNLIILVGVILEFTIIIGVYTYPEDTPTLDLIVTIHDQKIKTVSTSAESLVQNTSISKAVNKAWFTSSDRTVKFLFIGDMMFDRRVAERMRTTNSFNYPFDKICGKEKCLFDEWDFTIANLEGPVTAKRLPPVKDLDFAFDPKIAQVLKTTGIDAVSLANNHASDQGRAGLSDTYKNLKSAGVPFFGDEVADDSSISTAILEKDSTRIALVGFNVTDNPLDEKAAKDSVLKATAMADFTMIFIHWGQEYTAKPDQDQIKLAHEFLDWGADAVIGSHPHWMQSIEVYNGKPIVYSLGNFIFDQDWSVETNYGLTVGLSFSDKLNRLDLMPIKIINSQPELLTGTERQTRLDHLSEISDKTLAEQIEKGIVDLK